MAEAIPDTLPFDVMRQTWQPVALTRSLPMNAVTHYQLLGEELVIARMPDGLLAAKNACPHKGMRLELGCIKDHALQCAYHGWRFDAQGACLSIPSLLDPTPEKKKLAALKTFPTQERYGMIWVRLDPRERAPLPNIPEFEDPSWTYLVAEPMPFQSGFRREIENYLDMTHFAFAHAGTLGAAATPVVPPMNITTLSDGFEMDAPFPALQSPDVHPNKLQEAHHRRQRCFLPNFTTIRQTFADGDQRVLVHIPSPNSADTCTVFWALAISPNFKGPAPEEQMSFAIQVLDEDRTMCENQLPREVPINPASGGWGVLVTPGDTLANTFQKCFRGFLLDTSSPLS
jgi:phenylpropionate dioxygenase-like ring-hydroxylating dioxygenase large terminal subunit